MARDEDKSRAVVYSAMALTVFEASRLLALRATGRMNLENTEALLQRWARRLFRIGHLDLEVHGLANVPRDQPVVLMSNHASLLDIPAIFRSFPGPVRMVAKKELADLPVFGEAMRASGCLIVDRSDREQAIAALDGAESLIERGISLWIAPEGTRSKDGMLGQFKKGGFYVSKRLGLPVIPMWVNGTGDILHTKELKARTGATIRVDFGAPIEGASSMEVPELMVAVRKELLDLAEAVGAKAAQERQ